MSLAPAIGHGQKFTPNYDESKIPEYQLPELFGDDWDDSATNNPTDFESAWRERREVILNQFEEQMYGKLPEGEHDVTWEKIEEGVSVGGKARRKQWRVTVSTPAGKHSLDLLVFTPASATEPVPAFLGLNFYGNHTVSDDPEIVVTKSWCRSSSDKGVVDNRATEAGRGTSQSRWPIESIVDAGCGVATIYCGDIDPDFDDRGENGVHALFPEQRPSAENPAAWGTISAWAWGLSRGLDCIQAAESTIDSQRVVVIGHSRLGKTSLWAAATDERFAAAISNDSGCGGAALSRRGIGETVGRINDSFPHWFCENFKQYNSRESTLPMDQHQLVALIAPRPVYVASASDDLWADPKGEFLAAKLASPVYEGFGLKSLELDSFPKPGTASIGRVSYHLREGKHDINQWDWTHYLEFIDQL